MRWFRIDCQSSGSLYQQLNKRQLYNCMRLQLNPPIYTHQTKLYYYLIYVIGKFLIIKILMSYPSQNYIAVQQRYWKCSPLLPPLFKKNEYQSFVEDPKNPNTLHIVFDHFLKYFESQQCWYCKTKEEFMKKCQKILKKIGKIKQKQQKFYVLHVLQTNKSKILTLVLRSKNQLVQDKSITNLIKQMREKDQANSDKKIFEQNKQLQQKHDKPSKIRIEISPLCFKYVLNKHQHPYESSWMNWVVVKQRNIYFELFRCSSVPDTNNRILSLHLTLLMEIAKKVEIDLGSHFDKSQYQRLCLYVKTMQAILCRLNQEVIIQSIVAQDFKNDIILCYFFPTRQMCWHAENQLKVLMKK